ncbi:hypothetical protein EDB85DRAFT_2178346 [Lactarius pseudohatsudake]|nr:hypothetical protein EDB85DRAFT_344477 [Lactarius pseudohatsudake]KAH9025458.1 hypothetical protein EDB85DRAFT_2178346 [Lactarius pseudohatsudake]
MPSGLGRAAQRDARSYRDADCGAVAAMSSLDALCGVGGKPIAFAWTYERVIAVIALDTCSTRLALALHV